MVIVLRHRTTVKSTAVMRGKKVKISRISSAVAMAAAFGLVLSGCAAPATEPTVTPVDFKACGVSDEGTWKDKSFNESVSNGLVDAKTLLGVETATLQSDSTEDFGPNLQQMIDESCDLTIAVGFKLVAAVNAAAKANPTVNFVTVDGWSTGNANLKPFNYNMVESSYLAGYLAAGYSKSGVVGTYGGEQIGAVTDFMTGFYNGAMKYAADNPTKTIKVVGWNPATEKGDFMGNFDTNSGVSKTIAAAQIKLGADVIMPVAGEQLGALSEAIKDSGKEVAMIGVDSDRALNSPEHKSLLLTSVEKRMTKAVFDLIKELAIDGGTFNGDAYMGTLENEGTGLSPFYDFDSKIDSELKAKLDELKAAIIAGEIDPKS
jgi:basic membrane protein A